QTQAQAQAARPAIATLTPRGCFGVAAGFIPAPAADFSTYTLRRQIDDREALKSTPNDTAPAAKAPAAPAPAQWLLLDAKWPHKPAFGGYRTAISVPGNFPRL
ncbi:MAG: hypothetical protein KDJ49_08055, partial [Alphaproteobacteria bacterium]|nr:hypothetical protein [Alphaproteobacteria bacterium]